MDREFQREVLIIVVAELIATGVIYLMARQASATATAILAVVALFAVTCFWYSERSKRLRMVAFGNQVLHSPFEFLKLAHEAQKTIFVVGPSLHFLATEAKAKSLLFAKLEEDGFQVRILVSNPDEENLGSVLSKVSFTRQFPKDLQESVRKFQQWKKESATGRHRPLNLRVRKTDVVTFSLLAIDADLNDGRILIIPIPWNVAGPGRPCFLIEKRRQPQAFNTYYNAYHILFEELATDI